MTAPSMENADMMVVYRRLAERRRGTYGELVDMVKAWGRDKVTEYFKLGGDC